MLDLRATAGPQGTPILPAPAPAGKSPRGRPLADAESASRRHVVCRRPRVPAMSRPAPAGLRQWVPLAPFTTLGVGGPAAWFQEAASEEQVAEGVAWAREEGLPLFVLGGGSNLLIADDGFAGLVLRVATRGIRREGGDGERLVVA